MQARNEAQARQLYLRMYALDFRGQISHIVAAYRAVKKLNEANKLFADSIESLMNDEQAVSVKYKTLKEMVDKHSYIDFNFGDKADLLSQLRHLLQNTQLDNLYQHDLHLLSSVQADLQYENKLLLTQAEKKDDKHSKILAHEKEALLEKINELSFLTTALQATNHRLFECNTELTQAVSAHDNSIQVITEEIKSLMELAVEQSNNQSLLESEIIKLRAEKTEKKLPSAIEKSNLPTGAHSPMLFKPRGEHPAPMNNVPQTLSSYGKRL